MPRVQETEVTEKAKRRGFTAEYKRRILEAADRCSQPGELGALLRREGLYSSHLATWRKQREAGELAGLTPKKRGPKTKVPHPLEAKVGELERELARAKAQLTRAEAVIDVQKKVSELLGVPLPEEKP
jgi:transposase-like protein